MIRVLMCVDAFFCEIPIRVIICYGRVDFDDGWNVHFVVDAFEHGKKTGCRI